MSRNHPERQASTAAGKRYHHGNLRDTLISAAAELIEESGSDDFALIDAARKAGVSNAAPYRHFRDKDDLLRAVSELGFYDLSLTMQAIAREHQYGSEDCILALGKGYIRFVTSRPAFFNLMWGDQGYHVMDELEETHQELKVGGFWLLVNQVDAWAEQQQAPNTDPLDIAMKLWALAIGISHLVINNHIDRFAQNLDPYEVLATSTTSFLRGLLES